MQDQFSSDTFHYSLVVEVFYGLFRRKTTVPGIPFDKQLTIEVCFRYRSRIPGFAFFLWFLTKVWHREPLVDSEDFLS